MNQVKLFIGSASESLELANALAYELRGDVKTDVWNNCFRAGQYTLEELKEKLRKYILLHLFWDEKIRPNHVAMLLPHLVTTSYTKPGSFQVI